MESENCHPPVPVVNLLDPRVEPTDEELAALMHDVALTVRAKAAAAKKLLLQRVEDETQLNLKPPV